MNKTRNGKIARLSRDVRDLLNRRLHNGEEGKKLVAWLNALPEVRATMAEGFEGKPIREQNLSEWKQGGYREWLANQEAKELVERLGEEASEWETEGRVRLTDTLSLWLAARYAMATREIAEIAGPKKWRLLREMCADVVELRRGDHSAERLRLDGERVAIEASDSLKRYQRKVITGVETLMTFAKKNSKAKAALDELFAAVRHPFDPSESE
jgi:hypothetical protein